MFQKRFIKIFAVVVVLLLICFLCRNGLLQFAFKRAQGRANERYHVKLSAASIQFSGFDGVKIENMILQPEDRDTLIRVKEVFLNLSLIDLMTGRIGFDEIKIRDALVTIYDKPEHDNIPSSQTAEETNRRANAPAEMNYRKMAMNLKAKLVRSFNTAFELDNIQFHYEDTAVNENVFIPQMKYDLKNLSGLLVNRILNDTMIVSGQVIERSKRYELSLQHKDNVLVYLPFLNRDRHLKCRFESIAASIDFENAGDELQINTRINAKDFHINHWRLANDDVVFEKAEFNGRLNVREDGIELDSSSTIKLKDLQTHVFASYSVKPDTIFTMSITMPETISDTFFHALPQGMFNTLKGISCSGSLECDLFFSINTRQPDSLVFSSNLAKKNLNILHYGVENYERMNGPFTYAAYDKDRFVRNIEISPSNPSFTSLNHISELLVRSVLQSEDPSFMQHRGFLPESFRESIIQNYKERRFARGGSTISMQLVKNVFLSRDKTVSRKAEEALIVYLIENLHLVPKERMLEVYLNVIEWGPNVYGIGEAARFYFNKTPAELNLQECVFLAGIIPAPKFFKYQFDKEGRMKPYLSGYFKILTARMASKGWITAADTAGLRPDVKLNGPALRMVMPIDTIMPEPEDE